MNGQDTYDQWLFVAGRPRVLGRVGPEMQRRQLRRPSGEGGKDPGQTK